jgi:hypothetical protein
MRAAVAGSLRSRSGAGVVLRATYEAALTYSALADLKRFAVDPSCLVAAAGQRLNSTRFERMNEINIISPYKHLGMWVFDDARVKLTQEPSPDISIVWIDGGARTTGTGIIRSRSIWKAGDAQRCFDIFRKRRNTSMFRSRRGVEA